MGFPNLATNIDILKKFETFWKMGDFFLGIFFGDLLRWEVLCFCETPFSKMQERLVRVFGKAFFVELGHLYGRKVCILRHEFESQGK